MRQQIQERPLLALGAAFVGGFLFGSMSSGEGGQSQQSHEGSSGYRPSSTASGLRSVVHQSGLDETIANAAALFGSMTDQLKSTLDRNFPGFTN